MLIDHSLLYLLVSGSFHACDLALGTFGDVEYVLLVGVAGGVPHYTDYYKHVRLGDIVVSTPNDKNNLYIFCDDVCVRSSCSPVVVCVVWCII